MKTYFVKFRVWRQVEGEMVEDRQNVMVVARWPQTAIKKAQEEIKEYNGIMVDDIYRVY